MIILLSGLDIHENCCLGVQRHPPTYMGRRGFQDGPETMFQMGVTQMWYLVSVTGFVVSAPGKYGCRQTCSK